MKRGIIRTGEWQGTRHPARVIRSHGRPRPVNVMTRERYPMIELPEGPEPEPEPVVAEQPKPAARAMKAGKR
jgi:hypothetical protein